MSLLLTAGNFVRNSESLLEVQMKKKNKKKKKEEENQKLNLKYWRLDLSTLWRAGRATFEIRLIDF